MQHWKLGKWCYRAVSKILYPPDRRAVLEELRQHMDDRSDLFLSNGFSEEEAIEKTLQAMGDADELSILLAKIHRPFWGFAWSFTKIFSGIVIVGMLLALLLYHGPQLWTAFTDLFEKSSDTTTDHQSFDPYTMTEHPQKGMRHIYVTPGYEYSNSGYTVKLTEASLWIHDPNEASPLLGHLYFRLIIAGNSLWSTAPEFTEHLLLKDGLGNHYISRLDSLQYADDRLSYIGTLDKTGITEWTYDGFIEIRSPLEAQWIDIRYERDGRHMALRIDLTGGTANEENIHLLEANFPSQQNYAIGTLSANCRFSYLYRSRRTASDTYDGFSSGRAS